jgi:hypothetical protein
MQLRKPFQYLQEYLDNNPDKRQAYVSYGIAAAKLAVVPVNYLLKHLIEVQHLDLDAIPDLKAVFDIKHALSYDEDFDAEDFAPIHQSIHSTSPPLKTETKIYYSDNEELKEILSKVLEEEGDEQLEEAHLEKTFSDVQGLKEVLGKLTQMAKVAKDLRIESDNCFRAAAEAVRDDLSIEEVKKLMDRTEELKKVYGKPKPEACPIKGIGETVRASESPITHLEAFTLAQEMVSRGLCADTVDDIKLHVEEILKFPRDAFDSLKIVVLKRPTINSATKNKKPTFDGCFTCPPTRTSRR